MIWRVCSQTWGLPRINATEALKTSIYRSLLSLKEEGEKELVYVRVALKISIRNIRIRR